MEVEKLFSKEAEDAICGSVFINPDEFQDCRAIISHSDFYSPTNAEVWKAFEELHKKKLDIDMVTVGEIVSKHGIQMSDFARMVSIAPNSYNARSYAEVILDKSRRRRQVEIANSIVKGAHNGGVKIADIMNDLIHTTEVKKKSVQLADGLSEYYDNLLERFNNPLEVWGIPTTYKELDKDTGGLHKGHVFMISGAPGAGKSILMSAIILKSAMIGHSWAVYSLEVSKEDMINRWVGMITGMSESQLSSGKFDSSKWGEITKAIETLESLPIYINDMPGITTTEMSADLSKLQAETNIDAIAVDYLEILGDKADNKNDATAYKSTRFREICREKNLAGLIVQSMNKEGIGAATGGITQAQGGKKQFASAQSAMVGVSGPAGVMHDADTIYMLVVDPADDSGKTVAALPAKKRHGNGSRKLVRFVWHTSAPLLVSADVSIYKVN